VARASLVDVYISGLNLTAVTVVCNGRQCRIKFSPGGESDAPGEKVGARYFFRPSHAELVLATIGKEGLTGTQPAVLAGSIERAAALLGAPYQTLDELRKVAEQAVDEVQARVAALNQSGAACSTSIASTRPTAWRRSPGPSVRCPIRHSWRDASRRSSRRSRQAGGRSSFKGRKKAVRSAPLTCAGSLATRCGVCPETRTDDRRPAATALAANPHHARPPSPSPSLVRADR
jgi:hypothetical protein